MRSFLLHTLGAAFIALACFRPVRGQDVSPAEITERSVFQAADTLAAGEENSAEARACLDGLCWRGEKFSVHMQRAEKNNGDWLVRFPSARPSGQELNDSVALEWYQAKDDAGRPITAPAVVVVHESGGGMTVGRLIAHMLSTKGLHTFLIHLPYYGSRRTPDVRPQGERILAALKQSVADTRRARDAVAGLPYVEAPRISLQGTSLGGFVAATTAGLDQGYDRVFILLAGGDIHSVLMEGKREAAKFREELTRTGLSPAAIKEQLAAVEPLRLAHRVNARRTWVFSGTLDEVVPLKNAELFVAAAGLDKRHHVKMLANHYSGVIFLPLVVEQINEAIRSPLTE